MTKYELGNILIYEQPTKYIVKSENYDDAFATPVLTPGQTFILGYTNETDGIYSAPLPVIIFDDFTTATKLVNFPFKVKSSAMKILKPASDKVYIPYWYYYLSSLKVDNGLHKRYWISTFANRQISAPSFPEQKRIATLLDKEQELIAKQKEQIAKLDLLIKSRFLDMFGDPITNPKGWIVRQIGQVSKIVSGTTPSTQNPIYWQGNLPWLTPAEIPDNMNYINNTQRKISLKAVRDCSLRLLPRGTVILSSRAPIGKVAIAGVPLYCNQGFKNLILDDKQMNAVFVCYLLRQRVTEIISLGRGATFKEISKDIVSHISIYVPPLFLQNQFANFVKSVEQQKEVFSARLSHLEVLYKSLIQEYFG